MAVSATVDVTMTVAAVVVTLVARINGETRMGEIFAVEVDRRCGRKNVGLGTYRSSFNAGLDNVSQHIACSCASYVVGSLFCSFELINIVVVRERERQRDDWHVKFRRTIYIERLRVTVEECDHPTKTLDKVTLNCIQLTFAMECKENGKASLN